MDSYLPILVLMGLSLSVGGLILLVSYWLGPKNPLTSKLSPYECGVVPEGSAHSPLAIRFYLVAVMFLLLDVEAAFFFPWALVYRESLSGESLMLPAITAYIGIFLIGLFFIIKKDCLRMR